ncbi:phosphatase PAP2 family protein [Actinomadura sp. HBU206391]|nr:phosphatase PAP2 family protein [Actinomadura sp. HBU206391]
MPRTALSAIIALTSLVVPASFTVPAAASPASGNAVVTWDINAQTAIFEVAAQPQTAQVRSFAMVNGAVYDAVNAIAGTPYQPYLLAPPATGTESRDAAVATAAYRVLVDLFPEQQERLQAQYDRSLATIPDGPSEQGGIAVGGKAAAAMIAARQNDGVFGDQAWVVGTRPGEWRPTPPTFDSQGAWLGQLKPFLIPDATMFRTAGPPALTSRAYARDVNEVKRLGSQSGSVRTQDQTEAASWWHDRRSTGWEIKRQLVKTQRLNMLQTARMFAMVDLSVADAGIACYNEKAAWSFWRPITAIQLADTDGNPRTTPDPTWTPLLVTPPFPEYTSGHACAGGARMSMFTSFFGRNNIPFSAFSVDTGTTRHFDGFSQAMAEAIDARVWGGIHFRTADTEGANIGIRVTDFITRHYFRPLR